ncbi:type III-E CRISPR-associated RpoE-like sigma factor [Desulfonema magnum]|uniref:RNA polymerase sigma factor, sigma-70 family n=1 Tax=Desulfonema magnum TaxID=45655 RepID=A0A975BRL9_9BACT|nr:type III-E CRISPR-associated RpoE-like sigma factor [Desulfonema magnum]QTA90442.1 RNA polymerase sigma factor, sigma-70 family [Desulfonema magnum]
MKSEEFRRYPNECLRVRGNGTGCEKCAVKIRNFCPDVMIELIEKMSRHLSASFKEMSQTDQDAILSDTVFAIWQGVERFEGRRGARFSTWAWRIFNNKTTDYLRHQYRYRKKELSLSELLADDEQHPAASDSIDENKETEQILIGLKQNMPDDVMNCIQLLIELDEAKQDKKTQEYLADKYGLKTNTLTKRIVRCRKRILLYSESIKNMIRG